MKLRHVAWLCVLSGLPALAQERVYDPLNEWSVFPAYANDSSHILIGQSEARRLLVAGGSWDRRVYGNRDVSWRWSIEVQPLILLQNPVQTTVSTINYLPPYVPLGGGATVTSTSVDFTEHPCAPFSSSGPYYLITPNGRTQIGTFDDAATCSTQWTYGGGLSPLGQRVNFLPRRRLQPYLTANAGFVAFQRVVPSVNATAFNFSFEFAGGVEFFKRGGRYASSWAADVRYHHISNAGRGDQNPGIDSAMGRITYRFGR